MNNLIFFNKKLIVYECNKANNSVGSAEVQQNFEKHALINQFKIESFESELFRIIYQ